MQTQFQSTYPLRDAISKRPNVDVETGISIRAFLTGYDS